MTSGLESPRMLEIFDMVEKYLFDEFEIAIVRMLPAENPQHIELLNGEIGCFKETGIMIIEPVRSVQQVDSKFLPAGLE